MIIMKFLYYFMAYLYRFLRTSYIDEFKIKNKQITLGVILRSAE